MGCLPQLRFRLLWPRSLGITIPSMQFLRIMACRDPGNPAKEEPRVLPPLEKVVDVNQSDIALLGKALGASAWVDARLDVIVLGEWRSGV